MPVAVRTYDGLEGLPSRLRIYGASDFATMKQEDGKREPDYTEHGVWGLDTVGGLWAIDWWSGQEETDVSIAAFLKLVRLWKPSKWFNEGGLIDKAIGPQIRKEMRRTRTYVSIESLPSMTDKSIKLQAFHAMAGAGQIHIPVKRKWADHLVDQLVKFPGGRFDDAADVCGLIGRGIDKMFDATIQAPEEREMLVPFTGKWLEWEGEKKPKIRYF